MAYRDFTLEGVATAFGVTTQQAALFPNVAPVSVPPWLSETLSKRTLLALISEKARSEFIVAPVLLATRDLCQGRVAIFSGQRLDVDFDRGLIGECDFILALAPPVPPLRAPLVMVVEAKKNDIEAGLGQCVAQMIATCEFNRSAAQAEDGPYGCVTTGEIWQFLRLWDKVALLEEQRYYLDHVGAILAVFQAMVAEAVAAA